MVTTDNFHTWLEGYKAGWVGQDVERTLSLFTDDATYMYTPFHDLMHGKDAIGRYIEKSSRARLVFNRTSSSAMKSSR